MVEKHLAIISKLRQSEKEAIIDGLAMMSYNPSIGRVLEKGGVDKFRRIMTKETKKLQEISSESEFDDFHHSIVSTIVKGFKTARGSSLSYGQAQKPLNVFLKVYVDWAGQSTSEKAKQLRKFLHVPLDSILMEQIKVHFPDEFKEYVVAAYDSERDKLRRSLVDKQKEVNESDLRRFIDPSNFSLQSIVFYETYYAWQKCARAIYPKKPVLLDVFWSIERR